MQLDVQFLKHWHLLSAMALLLCIYFTLGTSVFLLIRAAILRIVCFHYNQMAGGEASHNPVPQPGFGKAMLIVFVTALPQWVVYLVTGNPLDEKVTTVPLSPVIGFLIGFPFMAAMLRAKLPTTFGRSLLIALIEHVIMIVIYACIFVFVLVLATLNESFTM